MKTGFFTLGILAHVDAGKTTLAEGLFYLTGKTRHLGRVDHGDAFFDYYEMERSRGITIYSKTATLPFGENTVTLLDTPGHVDFSAEMERSLSVMDYAVLLISGTDGVQSHTRTVFDLLGKYHVPTFVFVNKMDRPETDRDALMQQLKSELDERCVDFSAYADFTDDFSEEIALCDEAWMESWLGGTPLTDEVLQNLISGRSLFPCFFGSALKMEGVKAFYDALSALMTAPDYPDRTAARVFKVFRDGKGTLLSQVKVTGGRIAARQQVTDQAGREYKIGQIRLPEGGRSETLQEASAGMVVAVTGLDEIKPGETVFEDGSQLGRTETAEPYLRPVLQYTITPEEDTDPQILYRKILELAQEEPEISISWDEKRQEIHAQLMGEVQIEILKQQILDRYDEKVAFEKGSVVYRETIEKPVIGIGHFEPIRHYAEVHVLIEPGDRGSGVRFENRCPDELLDRGWQATVMRHLQSRKYVGVLTGAELTDVTISLIAGRAHKKHSEGADFREAAWRAVRQGLMMAESILLEPIFAFTLELPSGQIGRAMTDIRNMGGSFADPEILADSARIQGRAPVSALQDYGMQVQSYTGGLGKLSLRLAGYDTCQNADEIIEQSGYDADADLENPASSLFFSHGAARFVPWDEVPEYVRVNSDIGLADDPDMQKPVSGEMLSARSKQAGTGSPGTSAAVSAFSEEDKELQAIFERTYGGARDTATPGSLMQPAGTVQKTDKYADAVRRKAEKREAAQTFLLVDGYNIIHAWEELKDLAKENLDSARDALMDILSDYHGSRDGYLIVVFDAYRVRGGQEHTYRFHNIDIVFTREAETADAYIERVTKQIAKGNDVTVATSDALEQMIIWGHGARRMSASELKAEVENARIQVREYLQQRRHERTRLFDGLSGEDAAMLEEIRLGRNTNK